MSHAISLEPAQSKSNDAAVDAIARDTATSPDVVRAMYEEECEALRQDAKILTFVGVIASRNVKRHLRSLDDAEH